MMTSPTPTFRATASKPMKLNQLTHDDVTRCLVWEVRGASDAVAEVQPAPDAILTEIDRGVFIATTDFLLADGYAAIGFCSPTDSSGLDYIQPVIFIGNAQIPLWAEPSPSVAEVEATWLAHGKALREVFPIMFACRVAVDGEFRSGLINLKDVTLERST